MRTIHVLVLGDEGVGKTTFISTLVSQMQDAPVVPGQTLQPVILPPNMCMSSEQVYTELVDTQVDKTNYRESILQADIVLLLYDITISSSVDRVGNYWLTLISDIDERKPVIIVGNKTDRAELEIYNQGEYPKIRDVVRNVVRRFRQVEMGLECSAYYDRNVNAVLGCAQRAVLFPMSPLYDITKKDLTEKCKRALTRIFRVLDADRDGVLSDLELSGLQQRVFQSQLNIEDTRKIKELIQIELQEYNIGAVSLKGFLALNKKCIELKNLQICWSIIRKFGYDDNLNLTSPTNRLLFKRDNGNSVQLKEQPIDFLTKMYTHFLKQLPENSTTKQLLDLLFYPLSYEPQIYQSLVKKEKMELADFVVEWHYLAYSNYEECFRSLLGIGYDGSLQDTFLITCEKISFIDILKIKDRNVLSVGIIESDEQKQLIESFFIPSVEQHSVPRSSVVFGSANSSKLVFLFKLTHHNIQQFLKHYPLRMLDVVVYFQKPADHHDDYRIAHKVPDCVMRKKINHSEAMELLGNLDKDSFPIVYKKETRQILLNKVWQIIKNPQEGFTKTQVAQLQKLNKREWLEPSKLIIGVGVLTGLVLMGKKLIGH